MDNISPKFLEFEGKNINDAIKNAMESLCLPQEDLDIKHIDVFKKGIFKRTKKVRIQIQITTKPKARSSTRSISTTKSTTHTNTKKSTTHTNTKKSTAPTSAKMERKAKMKDNACEKVVTDFIIEVGKLTGCEVQFNIQEQSEEQVLVSITGDDAENLIGKYGRTLLALQLLVNAVVRNCPGKNPMYFLDINDYWARRKEELDRLVHKKLHFVKKNQSEELLPPLNSYERRIVYKILTDVSGISAESIETPDSMLKQIRISLEASE